MVSKLFQGGKDSAAEGVMAAFGKPTKAKKQEPPLPSMPEASQSPSSSSSVVGWGAVTGLLVPQKSRVTGKRTRGRWKNMSKMIVRSVTPRFSKRQMKSRAHGLHGPLFRKFQTAALVVRHLRHMDESTLVVTRCSLSPVYLAAAQILGRIKQQRRSKTILGVLSLLREKMIEADNRVGTSLVAWTLPLAHACQLGIDETTLALVSSESTRPQACRRAGAAAGQTVP